MAKRKISFWAKLLGIRPYLNEVSVEGKINDKFLRKWDVEVYVRQIIRVGNCTTLLSNKFTITEETFWNLNYFKDYAQYVYWTFNESFLEKIIEGINLKPAPVLSRFRDLLLAIPNPYMEPEPEDADDELRYSYLKKRSVENDNKKGFDLMFSLDRQNRQFFLLAVEKRISELNQLPTQAKSEPLGLAPEVDSNQEGTFSESVTFLDMLRPIDNSREKTLQFINDKVLEAEIPFELFSPVIKKGRNRNPHYFNYAVAAMIEFFFERGYFEQQYTDSTEIFRAYFKYSGNEIGKYETSFRSEFRKHDRFLEYTAQLKSLKIKKLP